VKLGLSHCVRNVGGRCQNRVPRKIFELKRDEVRGDRRKLHDESFTVCVFMYF